MAIAELEIAEATAEPFEIGARVAWIDDGKVRVGKLSGYFGRFANVDHSAPLVSELFIPTQEQVVAAWRRTAGDDLMTVGFGNQAMVI